MKSKVFRLMALLSISLVLLAGCGQDQSGTTAPAASTSETNQSATFRSDQVFSTVSLPPGWAAAQGPEAITVKSFEGEVAFNSWAQPDFWAREVVDGNSHRYNQEIMLSQLPEGGAYVALVQIFGPPILGELPAEYSPDDLSGLFTSH